MRLYELIEQLQELADTCDEVDVVAPRSASLSAVLRSADLDTKGYAGCLVVGVLDQTAGEVLAEAWNGDLLTEEVGR